MEKELCPYYGECGIVNNCELWQECRVKELFDDFYLLEKKYLELEGKYRELKDNLEPNN